MTFEIRTRNGQLKAKIANEIAVQITRSLVGFWRNGVYYIEGNYVYEISSWGRQKVELFLWKGDRITQCE